MVVTTTCNNGITSTIVVNVQSMLHESYDSIIHRKPATITFQCTHYKRNNVSIRIQFGRIHESKNNNLLA